MPEGREGDWECGGCRNRNYAFRSFCNRCKQPRLVVDTKIPADSKWLPRIGDWICSGCSNNNYASREKCKKCGQPKEEVALPATAMSGASLPTYAHYFAKAYGLSELRMNYGIVSNSGLHPSVLPSSSWSYGGLENYGLQSFPRWLFHGNSINGVSHMNSMNQPTGVPKDWRNGDWICNCGFHNYSSRSQCKKCNAPLPSDVPSSQAAVSDMFPTLGMKRLASEEFIHDWDNKRLNAGDTTSHFLTNGQQQSYHGFEQLAGSSNDQSLGISSAKLKAQATQLAPMPMLVGKGAKQWRDGDWMCNNCNNHNYASRTHCNRCKTEKEAAVQPVSVA